MPGPIRNDNRDPARDKFAVPGIQLPTPNIADLVIVRQFTVTKGQRWRADYGTPDDEFNGQNGNTLARLVKQSRKAGDNTDFVVTRVYATDRVNQDAYNAAVTYTAQSGARVIYTRSYLVLRSTYAPVADLTPDSAVPTALCTQESATEAEDPYGTLYYRVTRVFEDFGSRTQQDTWNREDSYPYLLATAPRLTRKYRVPANGDFCASFAIGATTDTVVTGATLISLLRQDESARVRVYTAVFDAIPSINMQAGVGIVPGGIVALGVTVTYPEDPAYPVLSWSFRELKSAYVAPTAVNLPCPIPGYTSLVQTNESAVPDEETPTVLIVTREYQILPGPIISATDSARLPRTLTPTPPYYLNGDLLTTTHQKLPYGAQADEDSATILSSKIEATSTWYVIKTNITRSNPLLPLVTAPAFVEGEDGTEYRMEVVVDRNDDVNAQAAALNAAVLSALSLIKGNYTTVDYKTNPLAPNEAEIVYTQVSSYTLKNGQEYDGKLDLAVPYTEQIVAKATADALIGTSGVTITPINKYVSKVRTEVQSASPLNNYLKPYVSMIPRLDLPDILIEMLATVDKASGQGFSVETGSCSESGGGTLNLNIPNSGQGSAALSLDVTPRVQSVDARNVRARDLVGFVPDGTSDTDILAHFSSLLGGTPLNFWPLFQPMSESVLCVSQKVSARATASARISIYLGSSSNSSAISQGVSIDRDVSVTTRNITTKPVIHGDLNITGTTSASQAAIAAASASIGGFVSASAGVGGNAQAYANTTHFPATPGVSVIPTSGVYVYRMDSEGYRQGFTMVRLQVVDFATLPVVSAGTPTRQAAQIFTDTSTLTGTYAEPAGARAASALPSSTATPTITTQPQSQVEPAGMLATFIVAATGAGPLSYQWLFNGTAISGATSSKYNVICGTGTVGTYSVQVSNANGATPSSNATLSYTPQTAPTITTQPASQSTQAGGSATFSVVASGVQGTTLTYQWLYNGGAIDGATYNSYTVSNVSSDNAGSYTVVVSDGTNTTTSNAATLTVVPAITVTTQPSNQSLGSGGVANLTATATGAVHGAGGALGSIWYKVSANGAATALPYGSQSFSNTYGNDFNTTTTALVNGFYIATTASQYLMGTPVPVHQNGSTQQITVPGNYYCKFTDYYGNSITSNQVTVDTAGANDAPTITTNPSSIIALTNHRGAISSDKTYLDAPYGSNTPGYYLADYLASFSVAASSDLPLVYRWLPNGQPYQNTGKTAAAKVVVTTDPSLALASLTAGVYSTGGNAQSTAASIIGYFLDFENVVYGSSGSTPTYPTVSATSSVGLFMNFYSLTGGGTAPSETFNITLTQTLPDGTPAHGSFSTNHFNSVTHTSGLHWDTPTSTYTPSATDAGKDVTITASLNLSTGPVTGTVGNVSMPLHITT